MAEPIYQDKESVYSNTESICPNKDIAPDKIDLKRIPCIGKHFRLQWEEVQNAFVLLYPEGMVKLNESAGEILSRCDGKSSIQDIVMALSLKFPDVKGDDIQQDILAFFAEASEHRWIGYESDRL